MGLNIDVIGDLHVHVYEKARLEYVAYPEAAEGRDSPNQYKVI